MGPIPTARLELRPLPVEVAGYLEEDPARAERELGVRFEPGWPGGLTRILPRHAALAPEAAIWGIWLIVEPNELLVVGDVGFHGPPSEEGVVEVGYSIVPSRRRRGYATEALMGLIAWASARPEVRSTVAGSDPRNEASIATLLRAGLRQTEPRENELRWVLAK